MLEPSLAHKSTLGLTFSAYEKCTRWLLMEFNCCIFQNFLSSLPSPSWCYWLALKIIASNYLKIVLKIHFYFIFFLIATQRNFSFIQNCLSFQLGACSELLYSAPWTAAHQTPLSFTVSQSLLKLMSIKSMMPSNHLILCRSPSPAFNLSQHQGLFQ